MRKIQNIILRLMQSNVFMLLLLVATGSYICVQTRFDFRWDFTNYHYYNAFAFFNNRLNYDIVPGSVNTFFNPLIELPLFFLIEYFNDKPEIIFAVQGIWFGLLLFSFFKLVNLFFELDRIKNVVFIILTICVAATGQATWFQAGSSTNEIPIAFFVFSALYIILKMIKYPKTERVYKYFISGLILGMSLGLKSTTIFLCISTGLTLILCAKYLQKPLLSISAFTLAGLVGYLLINGWWMYKMWSMYDNPFFPFLNKIFNSPYFDNINFADRRFIPPLFYALFYPYIWCYGDYRAAEIDFYDLRGAIFYSLALCFIFYLLIRPKRLREFYSKNHIWFFFCIFMILSYILWLSIFSIYRYIVIIEMSATIYFMYFISLYNPKSSIKFILYYSFVLILSGILILNYKEGMSWPRPIKEKFVMMEDVKLPTNTLLKLYNFPTAGVIPVLAKTNSNKFRALGYKHINASYMNGSDFVERGRFREIRDKIEKEHTGPIIVIYRTLGIFNPRSQIILDAVKDEIADKYCRKLENNLDKNLTICVPKDLKDEILH